MKLSKYGFNVALVLLLVPGIARAENPDLNEAIGTSTGGYAYVGNSGGVGGNGVNGVDTPEDAGINASDLNAFGIKYGNNKIITGHGRCSTRAGTTFNWDTNTYNNVPENFVETLTNQTGQEGAVYCYCKLETYISSGNLSQSLSGPWVLTNDWSDSTSSECADSCAGDCANILSYNDPSYYLSYRTAVFNAYAPSSSASGDAITTQTYVDNALNGKQAKITTTGTNKLMTYGASTGATPGSRDIVTTLGTSTSATTVPTAGPIVTAVNNKQNAVNGTADYVMTGTGTAGTLGEKPVYSATTNYTNALVTAQTINAAAANAANGEMSCHTYVSGQSQTPANCLLWQIVQSAPTGLVIHIDLNTIIGADTSAIAYAATDSLGVNAQGNPQNYGIEGYSSAFAVDYGSNKGVVTGRGACSSASGTSNYNYSTVLDSLPDTSGGHCWCKLDGYTSPSGAQQSLSSRWVYLDNLGNNVISGSTQTQCENACALNCGDHLRYSSAYPVPFGLQIALFNAVQ